MNYAEAIKVAEEVRSVLAPLCLRCEIAGSVRRKKQADIKDVEIVAIPDSRRLFDLAAIVNAKWGTPSIGKFPSRYTRVRSAYTLDLFWADRETWGLNFFIRTGPADYSMRGLARWKQLTGGKSEGAKLYDVNGVCHPTLEEADVFTLLKWEFVEPEKRR